MWISVVFRRSTFIPVSSGGGKSFPTSFYIDEGRKIIYFTLKIPVKIKLHNPLSLNNFTITDKRLYSVKQVTKNITEHGFSEVRIILYTQLNFKYRCLVLNMQYLNIFEGGNVRSLWSIHSLNIELQKARNCIRTIRGLSTLSIGKILLYACIFITKNKTNKKKPWQY